MGFIEVWLDQLAFGQPYILAALCVLLVLIFSFLNKGNSVQTKDGAHSGREGQKITNDETVLVGASDEETWSWIAEMRAMFRYMGEGHHLMYAAFKRNSEGILRAPLADYKFYILPPHYMEELKSLPTRVISSSISVQEYLLGDYTTMKAHTMMGDVTWGVIRNHLTQKLGTLVEPLNEACQSAFRDELPGCTGKRPKRSVFCTRTYEPGKPEDEWTPVPVHDVLLQIVGRMTGRIFVGEELSKNKLMLHTFIDFATCVFVVSSYLKVLPSFIRPLAAIFVPHIWKIQWHHHNARKLLLPEIRKRMQESPERRQERKLAGKQDMLDWLIEASGSSPDEQSIVLRQLGISFAAIHTTSNHMTNVLYDLAARWDEYAPDLLAEYRQALAEDGGVLKKTALTKLGKLDSFMKESQRLNPPSSLAFNRKVLQDYTLSDGKVLPKSCWIAVAAGPLMLTESQFNDPLKFDGFRYHRMRQQDESESKTAVAKTSQFTSTGIYSLVFGHGRYACPGRFFAGLESKLMLIYILENYELRLPEGTSRPTNLIYADANIPDPTKTILFRRLVK